MESISSEKISLVSHILEQLVDGCEMIMTWNADVVSVDGYLQSPDGMQKMAASCMIIESIGEGLKKIDRVIPDFLVKNAPEVPWREIKGLRDHIAHGYFNIDASIVFDVSKNEIPFLKEQLVKLKDVAMTLYYT